MSKMRDKLRALHKPRPTEVPARTNGEGAATSDRPESCHSVRPSSAKNSAADGPAANEPANASRTRPKNRVSPKAAGESDHRLLTPDELTGPPASKRQASVPPRPTRAERARALPERLSAAERRAPLPEKSVVGTANTVTARGMAAWRKRRADTGSGVPESPRNAPSGLASEGSPSRAVPDRGDPPGAAAEVGRRRAPAARDVADWHRPPRHLSELTQGHVRVVDGRAVFVAQRQYASDTELAGRPLEHARVLPARALQEFDVPPHATLGFLDIESSGLSGQQGSVPFMVGIATWNEHGLLAEVVTMHEPADERGALRLVASLLQTVDAVVTFNGHVFDLPFLRHRFAAHGLDPAPLDLPHIDVYRVARKVLKGRKGRGAFKLTRLENDLLGIARDGDIPGSEAPPRWFQTQRDGEVERLLPLLEHNQHDIMTLPALLYALLSAEQSGERRAEQSGKARRTPSGPVARLAAATSHDPDARHTADEHTASPIDPASKTANEHRGDPVALLRRGLTAYQEGRFPEAAAMLEAADLAGLNKQQRWSALKTLAQVQDALGQTCAAEQTWRTLSELPSTDPLPLTRLVAIARDRGDDEAADALAERAKQRAAWWREE